MFDFVENFLQYIFFCFLWPFLVPCWRQIRSNSPHFVPNTSYKSFIDIPFFAPRRSMTINDIFNSLQHSSMICLYAGSVKKSKLPMQIRIFIRITKSELRLSDSHLSNFVLLEINKAWFPSFLAFKCVSYNVLM